MVATTYIDTIRITDKEMQTWKQLAQEITYPAHGAYNEFLRDAEQALATAVEAQTVSRLRSLADTANWNGPILVQNVPYDHNVTRGLIDPEAALAGKPNDLSEAVLAGIVRAIGEPYAILQEGKGLISHLSPKQGQLHEHTGLGAINELSEHIENAAARLLPGDRAPDGLALIGVSRERDASPGTLVSDGRLALRLQPPSAQAILRDPTRFLIRFPVRWQSLGFPESLPTAIVLGSELHPKFVGAFYGGLTEALDPEAQRALDRFVRTLRSVAVDLLVEPGTVALLDNRYQFHGRRAFRPAFDESGRPFRLVQRLFWTSSLERFGDWSRSRERLIGPKA